MLVNYLQRDGGETIGTADSPSWRIEMSVKMATILNMVDIYSTSPKM